MSTTKKLWCANCESYLEFLGSEETLAACPDCSTVTPQP